MTDALGPTPEALAKGHYRRPKFDRKTAQAAFRKESVLERLKVPDELKAAGLRLLRHRQGMEGHDVRNDETPRSFGQPADELRQHRHGRLYHEAKAAVHSPLTWNGLILLIDDQHELSEIGAVLGKYNDRASATAWAHGLLTSGLDILAIHWGIRHKPPD